MRDVDLSQSKEQFSLALVRAIAAAAGVSCYRPEVDDDSVDLGFSSRLGQRPRLESQVKCTSRSLQKDDGIHFPLKLKNYEDLRAEVIVPRVLIVAMVPDMLPDWLTLSHDQIVVKQSVWWLSLEGFPETENTETVTVVVPRANLLTAPALRSLLRLPEQA